MKIVSQYVASLAKDLGFEDECDYFYYNNKQYNCKISSKSHPFYLLKQEVQPKFVKLYITNAPFQDQLKNWLREQYGYYIDINGYMFGKEKFHNFTVYKLHYEERNNGYAAGDFYDFHYEDINDTEDYYLAFTKALVYTLELIKNR